MSYAGTLTDGLNELGFGCVEVAYEFDYFVGRDEVEIESLRIVDVLPQDGDALLHPVTSERLKDIEAWVDSRLAQEWHVIERDIMEARR